MAATIKITINSAETGGGIEKTTKDLKNMGDSAAKSGDGFTVMKGLAVNALSGVAGAALQAAAGVGKFLQDSVGAAGDFEAGMNSFKSAAGDMGQAELEEFRGQFIDIGKELPVSTKAVQDAATAMVKGGIDPAIVSAGALRDTIQFSLAAGFETLEEAADASAKLLGTWGDASATAAEQSTFLAHAQELVMKSANASALDADKLSAAMLMAAGSAKAAGVDFEEFVTVLGATATAFPSAAVQGTSFNNFFTRLIPSTNAAKDAMAALGLYTEETGSAFYDAQGNFVGMEEAARLMKDAFGGLTEAQLSENMATIFGNDAKNAAIAVMEQGAEGLKSFAAEMVTANGIAATSANTQQGLNSAWTNMLGSVEALQITIGTKLLPILTPLITQFTGVLNTAITLAEAIFGSDAAFNQLTPDLQALVTVVGAVVQGFSEGGLQGAITQASLAFPPLGMAIAVAQQAFANLSAFIATVMPSIQGIVTSSLTAITAFWQTHGATIQAVAMATWQAIVGAIQVAIGVIQGIVAIFTAALTGDYTAMGVQLTQANDLIWTGIRSIIEGFLSGVLALFGSSLDELIGTWQYNLSMIPVAAQKVMDEAIAAFESALGLAPGIGKAIIDGIAQGISSGAGKLVEAAKNAAKAAFEAAKNFLDTGSPSKLFANEVGLPIAQGMALGIRAGTPLVAGASAGMGQAAVASTSSVVNNYNYSPTYGAAPQRPQADFAAMRSLAGAGV